MVSGNGSYRRRKLEDGTPGVRKGKAKALFYFVMEILGSERHLSGNNRFSLGGWREGVRADES